MCVCVCCFRAVIESFIEQDRLNRGKVFPDVQLECAALQYDIKNEKFIHPHRSFPARLFRHITQTGRRVCC